MRILTSIILTTLFLSCAPAIRDQVQQLYCHNQFTSSVLQTHELTILPVLSAEGFVMSDSLSPRRCALWFARNRSALAIVPSDSLLSHLQQTFAPQRYSQIVKDLYAGNVLDLQNDDSLWREIPAAYCLVLRIRYGAKIKGFDGQVLRKVTLEAEVWDTKQAIAVWRAAITPEDASADVSDSAWLFNAMCLLLRALPTSSIPSIDEQRW